MPNKDELNAVSEGLLPGHLGIEMISVKEGEVVAQFFVQKHHMAPNGFLHAASVVALADTACGNGCMASLPENANGFTTVELKSNHLGTATEGTVRCVARAAHLGRTTQVWDAEVTDVSRGKVLALFRCTQMVLY